ncbi:hypothetical protein EDD15DRAFT_2198367 [Pisolithus albus]|nr:hypothetical protein EDD15DRAFT_2198367 [Pisolithus albus]
MHFQISLQDSVFEETTVWYKFHIQQYPTCRLSFIMPSQVVQDHPPSSESPLRNCNAVLLDADGQSQNNPACESFDMNENMENGCLVMKHTKSSMNHSTPLPQEPMPKAKRLVFDGVELRLVETLPWYAKLHQSGMFDNGDGIEDWVEQSGEGARDWGDVINADEAHEDGELRPVKKPSAGMLNFANQTCPIMDGVGGDEDWVEQTGERVRGYEDVIDADEAHKDDMSDNGDGVRGDEDWVEQTSAGASNYGDGISANEADDDCEMELDENP